jgi:hypothetical protein
MSKNSGALPRPEAQAGSIEFTLTMPMDVLLGLAEPIAYGRRDEFLQAVAATLASCPQVGPGEVYRRARELQRNFVLEAQRETSAEPRHLRARQAARSISHEGVARVLRAAET